MKKLTAHFRKDNAGTVYVAFPGVPAGDRDNLCLCRVNEHWMPLDAHAVFDGTQPMRYSEYKPLAEELRNCGLVFANSLEYHPQADDDRRAVRAAAIVIQRVEILTGENIWVAVKNSR